MNQSQLLNTSILASTKAMKALHRARIAKDRAKQFSSERGSAVITTDLAEPAAAPASSKTRSPENWQAMEFLMPDEYRSFKTDSLEPCNLCGYDAVELVKWRNSEHNRLMYAVRCASKHCANTTPDMFSSQLAVRHWQLAAKLAK
jgi:hypothetical protein